MGFFISDALAAPAADTPGMAGLVFPIAILIFFYFLFIRPQQKRSKEHKNLIDSLKRGAEVVTNGGLLGKVIEIDDNFVRVEVAENVVINVQRQAIANLMPKGTIKTQLKKGLQKNR